MSGVSFTAAAALDDAQLSFQVIVAISALELAPLAVKMRKNKSTRRT
jgi:hypothetical protein